MAGTVMGVREWGLLVLLSVLWGGAFFFVGVAVPEIPPFTLVALRVFCALPFLWGLLMIRGQFFLIGSAPFFAFVAMGLLNNAVPQVLIAWAQGTVSAGVASILNATTPLFTVLLAHVLIREEKMTPGKCLGVVLGFSGVVVMTGLDALDGIGLSVLAQGAVLVASLSYAMAAIYGRYLAQQDGVSPLIVTVGSITGAALVLVPLALALETPWTLPVPGIPAWGAVLGLAVLSTVCAYLLFYNLLDRVGASNASLVTFLIPVSAVVLGFLFLEEQLEPRHGAGMALIALGLAVLDGRLIRGRRPSPLQGEGAG
ncbi:DMT family transporter [Haematospirillum jordaniae]|nr:DMT family transporter [Haematospirillum jordaniae]